MTSQAPRHMPSSTLSELHQTQNHNVCFVTASTDLILHFLLVGMPYQMGCSGEQPYLVHLSLRIYVYVYELFMYSASRSA